MPDCGAFVAVDLEKAVSIYPETTMQYEYKVVPFIGQIKSGDSAQTAASQLQTAISSNARDGWEFYQLGDVNIEVQPGCLWALLGQKSAYVRYDQIVFRRATGSATGFSGQAY